MSSRPGPKTDAVFSCIIVQNIGLEKGQIPVFRIWHYENSGFPSEALPLEEAFPAGRSG
ncbi:hypothetical protein HMPREF1986_01689 [Oribacterium sp. oral taxon 078 str. F0263]|nr:hypothetical protein HMPREF1986_01689 [Oribacterium sp. oral taxon 078 str. F0263]